MNSCQKRKAEWGEKHKMGKISTKNGERERESEVGWGGGGREVLHIRKHKRVHPLAYDYRLL